MDSTIDIVILLLILFTTVCSWKGLSDSSFFERYVFEIEPILVGNQYYRLVSSGFLHLSWMHLLFNMIALYSFGINVGGQLGVANLLWVYGGSMLAGNLLLFFIHYNHSDYSAAGASGAISGVVFASIVLMPDSEIMFPFVPIGIKAWIFGILYMLFSLYGIKNQVGNIAHEAHVGGAIIGILTILIIDPSILLQHPWVVASLLLPFTVFMILLIKKPEVLLIEGYWGYTPHKKEKKEQLDFIQNEEELLNSLLDKVSEKGIGSLSKKERALLEKLSEK